MNNPVSVSVVCPVYKQTVKVYFLPFPGTKDLFFNGCETFQPCHPECGTVCKAAAKAKLIPNRL